MKNNELVSAAIGTTFFAIPYLALSVPILPSVVIGSMAFIAGELVLKKDKPKEKNITLYQTLIKAKKDNKHILDMIPKIDDKKLKESLKNIHETVNEIIKTIEEKPEKERNLKNFFDYYLPVTVKLVDQFDEIENKKITSHHSEVFNTQTRNTIIQIEQVFKQFLNNLYEIDMEDTSAEIKVLNKMLKADGLEKEMTVKEDYYE